MSLGGSHGHVRLPVESDVSQHREREDDERDVREDVEDRHGEKVCKPAAAFVA